MEAFDSRRKRKSRLVREQLPRPNPPPPRQSASAHFRPGCATLISATRDPIPRTAWPNRLRNRRASRRSHFRTGMAVASQSRVDSDRLAVKPSLHHDPRKALVLARLQNRQAISQQCLFSSSVTSPSSIAPSAAMAIAPWPARTSRRVELGGPHESGQRLPSTTERFSPDLSARNKEGTGHSAAPAPFAEARLRFDGWRPPRLRR